MIVLLFLMAFCKALQLYIYRACLKCDENKKDLLLMMICWFGSTMLVGIIKNY